MGALVNGRAVVERKRRLADVRRRLAHPLGAHDRDGGHTDGGGGDHHENQNDSHASPGGVRVANDGGEDAASSPPSETTSA